MVLSSKKIETPVKEAEEQAEEENKPETQWLIDRLFNTLLTFIN